MFRLTGYLPIWLGIKNPGCLRYNSHNTLNKSHKKGCVKMLKANTDLWGSISTPHLQSLPGLHSASASCNYFHLPKICVLCFSWCFCTCSCLFYFYVATDLCWLHFTLYSLHTCCWLLSFTGLYISVDYRFHMDWDQLCCL